MQGRDIESLGNDVNKKPDATAITVGAGGYHNTPSGVVGAGGALFSA
jgi:hypothetical protein